LNILETDFPTTFSIAGFKQVPSICGLHDFCTGEQKNIMTEHESVEPINKTTRGAYAMHLCDRRAVCPRI
jgi:hypothetical protein